MAKGSVAIEYPVKQQKEALRLEQKFMEFTFRYLAYYIYFYLTLDFEIIRSLYLLKFNIVL